MRPHRIGEVCVGQIAMFALVVGVISACASGPFGDSESDSRRRHCGNHVCDFAESCSSCPQDCGACCAPTTCVDAGAECGAVPDGCGGTLSCGTCVAPQTCGGGGVANVCGGGTSAGPAWSNLPFASQSGSFTASFDATPAQDAEDTVIGLSSGPAAAYTDLAAIVRFAASGAIDARNGSAYAAQTTLPYSAGTTYHIRMVVNVVAHTYSVYATPSGQQETLIGGGFAFRTEQSGAGSLANLGKYNSVGDAAIGGLSIVPDVCMPTTCADQGKNCGSISDGCGGTLMCGSCNAPNTCGGGGVPNVCGTTSSAGWTTFTPSSDTRMIYVSASAGNDANTGLSSSSPVKTIDKGKSLLRAGYPDWLLLKKGDVWKDEAIGYLCDEYGRSPSEPMLISSYGTGPRPLIKTNPLLDEAAIGAFVHSSGGCPNAANNVAVVGLEFYAYTRDPGSPDFNPATVTSESSGIRVVKGVTWMLIEDCKFRFYMGNGFDTGGTAQDVRVRRSVFVDSYSTVGHSVGLYTAGIANLLLEENFFDHNGWNAQISGAEKTIYNHNIYIHDLSGPATVLGNITSNASSFGLQQRPGGITTDNLMFGNSIGIEYGSTESATYGPLTHDSIATNNVIVENVDTQWGFMVYPDTASSIVIQHNIIAHEAPSNGNEVGIGLGGGSHNVNATNNIICAWLNPIQNSGTNNTISPNVTKATDCNGLGYPDPNRSIGSYDATLGGPGTAADFVARARLQSKDTWNPALTAHAVNNYIRAGFNQ